MITGLGVVSPVGVGKEEFRAGLAPPWPERKGRLPTWDFFGRTGLLRQEKTRQLDRLSQYAVAAGLEALAEAGWSGGTPTHPHPVGVIFGTAFGCVDSNEQYYQQFLQASDPRLVSPVVFQNTVSSAAAGQVSILCGLRGLNLTLTSGLTAGLQAVGYAAAQIRWRRAEAVLAGGIECPSPTLRKCLDQLRLWTQPAEDLVSEGAGLVMLESLPAPDRSARSAPYMEVLGSGWLQGRGPAPGTPGIAGGDLAEGLARSLRQALSEARCGAGEVGHVYVTGSSSPRLQRAEEIALEQVWGLSPNPPVRHDLKGVLGECLGAWGGLALVAAALQAQPAGETILINALDFDGNGACLVVRTLGRETR